MQVIIESLLSTWQHLSTELKKLNREIERAARTITRPAAEKQPIVICGFVPFRVPK
jgi:hypothetical protein